VSTFLHQYAPADWTATLDRIVAADAHPVDRAATTIWSAFYPLSLADAFAASGDATAVVRQLRIDGSPRLADGQIDTSHWFLYGHRFWRLVKDEVLARVSRSTGGAVPDLLRVVREVASAVAGRANVDVRLVAGVAYVALMTLRQVGLERFRADTPGAADQPARAAEAPDTLTAMRERDDRQGAFGFLRSARRFSVTFDERLPDGRFPILDGQHLTTAAAADGRDYALGPRRFHEGPIPAQCRSATCGTCWVGVLGGREKLNAIEPYEAKKLRDFGYAAPDEPHPVIRLACQAKASGNVTLVIPSWHGFIAPLQRRATDASSTRERA
jgi:ferredoxin